MPALVYLALLIDAPAAPLLTPFGWAFFSGLACISMTISLVSEIKWGIQCRAN